MGNFVNVPYSLAMRHQLYQCYLNLNTERLPGWTHNLDVGPGLSDFVCMLITLTLARFTFDHKLFNVYALLCQMKYLVNSLTFQYHMCIGMYLRM